MVTLTGNLTVMGTLGKLTLDQVGTPAGGGLIDIGGAATSKGGAVLIFDHVTDTGILSDMPIASITATEGLDTDAPRDTISAPRLGTLAIKGDKTHAGDFAANLTLNPGGRKGHEAFL
jgi:hypothetical protein